MLINNNYNNSEVVLWIIVKKWSIILYCKCIQVTSDA